MNKVLLLCCLVFALVLCEAYNPLKMDRAKEAMERISELAQDGVGKVGDLQKTLKETFPEEIAAIRNVVRGTVEQVNSGN